MVTPVHRVLGEKGRYKSRMFDFFVKNRLSPQELAAFIAVTLGCPAENVLVVTSSELQGIPPVELNALRCLCLYWHVTGDAALLVSLYRVEASPEEIQEIGRAHV